MTRRFTITYDYLCPFARIANEAVLEGVDRGKDWEATFAPFSLAEVHIEDGEDSVWDRTAGAEGTRGVIAHAWALAVRQTIPDLFPAFHLALFSARHDRGADINDEAVLREVCEEVGVDPDRIAGVVATGEPLQELAASHTEAVERWSVFGVPTFIDGDEAVFVRLMERHSVDDVEKVLDMLEWTRLNEFKRTTVPR
jgi:protein-disulfide isomerase-like protein with CxxC motif